MSLTTGINSIDALVSSSWASKAGTAVTLTYSFMTRLPSDATTDDANGFQPMTDAQKEGVRSALATWAAVANITFTEVAADGNLQMATNDQGKASSGYAYLPNGVDPTYLFTNNLDDYNYVFTPGKFGLSVLIHEIGHTLGFKHPGNYDSTGGDIDGPFLPAATDTIDYSQMSYNTGAGFALNGNYGVTPMLYDVQAIQYLYGANMSYHAGADTYAFSKDAPLQCIWDAGGTDTLDFSACTGATIIDLRAGGFSSTAPGYNNISIAYNVTIELAIAGNGGATIYANGSGNVITGGAGSDVIYEGASSDQITGGGGSDTVVFGKALSAYAFSGSTGTLSVSGEGSDTLAGIAKLQFSDTTIQLSNFASVVSGTTGNDALTAAAGNQLISGGAGIDTVTLSGKLASYKLTPTGSGITLSDLSGSGGTDLLAGVERLKFSDGSLALDTVGAAGSVYRIYSAMFNRAPDDAGLGFWIKALDSGAKPVDISQGFINSAEFVSLYGANASDETFVKALYNNVLHRNPDEGGMAFWVNALHSGGTRSETLVGFSDSAENIDVMSHIIPVGVPYVPYVG
jgi:Ca2+-binding RTX toxin-like protein